MTYHNIRLFTLWRREVLTSRSLGPAPIALPHEERAANSAAVHLARLLIHDIGLCFEHTASLAFVVHADYFLAQLELAARGGGREGLVEGHEALAVDDAARIEFGDARDSSCGLGGVEVDYFLAGAFECCGMELLDKVCRGVGRKVGRNYGG